MQLIFKEKNLLGNIKKLIIVLYTSAVFQIVLRKIFWYYVRHVVFCNQVITSLDNERYTHTCIESRREKKTFY